MVLIIKKLPAKAGDARDAGSVPGSGRFPAEGNGNPLQCSCLENSMDRGAWRDSVQRVAKSQTWLKQLSKQVSKVNRKNLSKLLGLRLTMNEKWVAIVKHKEQLKKK